MWKNTNNKCSELLSSDPLASDYNYKTHHQILGEVYFSADGLSVHSSNSSGQFATYEPITSTQRTQTVSNNTLPRSRGEQIRDEIRSLEASKRTTTGIGYHQINDSKWERLSLQITYIGTSVWLYGYKYDNSSNWYTTEVLCKEIPSDSPLRQEFKYIVTVPSFGTIYF